MGYFQPMVIYNDPDEERKNSIIKYIGNRLSSEGKKNFLCFVTGQTGNGKSYCALSMAEIYSEMFNIPFDPKYHVISSLKELLVLLTEPERIKKIKFGSVLVFDEPQIEGSAQSWQSEINQALSQLISTFRNQRLLIFFATPYKEMVAKSSRTLFHGDFLVEGYDLKTKLTKVKPRFLEWSPKKQDFYTKRLIIQYKVKGKPVRDIIKLDKWHVPIASKTTIDVYELKKKKFTDELNKKLLSQILMAEKQSEGKNKSDELIKVKQFYDKYGENYLKIIEHMPHLNPFTIEKYITFIKKSKKFEEKTQNTKEMHKNTKENLEKSEKEDKKP